MPINTIYGSVKDADHETRIESLENNGGGGGIGEAPNDGSLYARQNLGWTSFTPGSGGGGGGGNTYLSVNALKNETDANLATLVNKRVFTDCHTSADYGGGSSYVVRAVANYSGTPDGYAEFYIGDDENYVAQHVYEKQVNGRAVGINPDGSTDAANIIEKVIRAGFPLHVPGGTYKWNTECDCAGYDAVFTGDSDTVFDHTNYTGGSSWIATFGGAEDSWTTIGNVPTAYKRNQMHLNLPSGSYSSGECLLIEDESSYSYSPYRSYYRNGEFIELHMPATSLGANYWGLSGGLWDNYPTSAKVKRAPLRRVHLSNLSWISSTRDGAATGSNLVYGVLVTTAKLPYVENVKFVNGVISSAFEFKHCFGGNVINCDGKVSYNNTSLAYGVKIRSCQDMVFTGCRFQGSRVGVGHGRSGSNTRICNRHNTYIGCTFTSRRFAFDQHGTAEHTTCINCDMNGGAQLGARGSRFFGCTIRPHFGRHDDGWTGGSTHAVAPFYGEEMLSYDHVVSGCRIIFNGTQGSSQACLRFGINTDQTPSGTVVKLDGTFKFINNEMINYGSTGAMRIIDNADNSLSGRYLDLSRCSIHITGNSTSGLPTTSRILTRYVDANGAKPLRNLICKENFTGSITGTISGVVNVQVSDNYSIS